MKRILKIIVVMTIAISTFFISKAEIIRAATTVNNETELQAAINNQETEILIGSSFNITRRIVVSDKTNNITIKGQGNKLTAQNTPVVMFEVSGSDITFEDLHLDGNRQSKILRVFESNTRKSTVNIRNGSLKNASSWIEGSDGGQHSEGGAVYLNSSTMNITGTVIEDNLGIKPINPPRTGGMLGHGGGIYAYRSTLNLDGVTATNNVSGSESGGGVIYAHNTDVTITNSTFTGNHADDVSVVDNKGGVVAVHGGTLTSSGNTYNIAAKFNMGGAIYLHHSKATVTADKFEAVNQGDRMGISGGAIASSNSELSVSRSEFKFSGENKVSYAGGMIDITDAGKFELKDSTMTGSGSWWGGPRASTYGGAIAFETGSTVIALIENTKIENIASDHTGGAITLSTNLGERSAVNLTLRNTDIINTRAYHWHVANGGAIYNGPGNKVVIEGGNLRDNFSKHGGAIRNDGEMIISGGATILNSSAYDIGGGIYNDGYLKLDNMSLNANMVGSARHDANRYPNYSYELGGTNIYAAKDVIITPNATISANKDVRVIDGKSSILLTGELTNPIYVSVSEESKAGTLEENVIRKVGYVVAKGTEGYTPTKSDAVKLHYTSKVADTYPELHRQPISDIDDTTSVGKWDFVLNPETNNVVLGQRAKLVYNVNEANAKFADNTTTKEQLYELYSSSTPWTTTRQMTDLGENPTLEGTKFVGWHTDNASGKPYLTPADVTNNGYNPVEEAINPSKLNGTAGTITKFNFADSYFTNSTTDITTILPLHTINVYARYGKEINVTKDWANSRDKQNSIEANIHAGTNTYSATLNAGNNWTSRILVPLSSTSDILNELTYTVSETGVNLNSQLVVGTTIYDVVYSGNAAAGFTITNNQTIPKTTYTVNKVWVNGPAEKPSIEVQLYRNGVAFGDVVTLNNGTTTYTWNDLDANDATGTAYTYSVDEVNVPEHYSKEVAGNTITNTYVSPKTTYTVNKIWVNGPAEKPSIEVQLYRNGVAFGDVVTLNNGTTSYTWNDLDANDASGTAYTYSVDEVNVPEHYSKEVAGNTITNTYVSPKTTYTVNKVWVNGPAEKPSIEVQLYRNGVAFGDVVTLNNGTTSHTWNDLDANDASGTAYTYSVDEVNVPENYSKEVAGNTITNTYVSPKTTYTVNKVWVNGPAEKPSIEVQLYRNGVAFGDVVTLNNGTTSHTWNDLDANDASGTAYTYSVDEVNVPEHYSKEVAGNTITNTYVSPKTTYTVNKVWVNGPAEKPSIEVQLYRNGVAFGDVVTLNNGITSHTWNDLDANDASGTAYTYSVDEVNVPEHYSKEVAGNTITNTYIPPITKKPVDTSDRSVNYVSMMMLMGIVFLVLRKQNKA